MGGVEEAGLSQSQGQSPGMETEQVDKAGWEKRPGGRQMQMLLTFSPNLRGITGLGCTPRDSRRGGRGPDAERQQTQEGESMRQADTEIQQSEHGGHERTHLWGWAQARGSRASSPSRRLCQALG